MRLNLMMIACLSLAGCTGGSGTSSDQQAQLLTKDHNCTSHTDEASCVADTADGCHWLGVASQIACPPGQTCNTKGGFCEGESKDDPCVIDTQCTRLLDSASCGASPDCQWLPAPCPISNAPNQPAGNGAPGTSPPTCNDHVCAPVNVCEGLNATDCNANPACELLASTGPVCVQPQPACAPGSNCPPPAPCPVQDPPPPICVHKPLVCGGSAGGGSASSGSGSSSGGSTGSGSASGGGPVPPSSSP
jgi:hypothetical protein